MNKPFEANKKVSNNLWLVIFRDALKSLIKFIGFGFGGAVGCYLLLRQWLAKDWQALPLSIGIFILYTLVAATVIALRRAVSERNHGILLANQLIELRTRKERIENELKMSGLYVQNDVQVRKQLQADGFWLSDSTIEIKVIGNGELGIISHWNKEALSRDTTFHNYKAEPSVLQLPQGHKWRSQVLQRSSTKTLSGLPNYIEIVFYIDPPLRKGDVLRYRYTQRYKGTVALSLKDLGKVINSRRFLRDLFKEVRLYSILCPTDRLYLSILFHEGSLISDVQVIALYRDAPVEEETERARQHFTVTAQSNEQLFVCLDIPQPKINYMYGITWALTR